MSRVDVSELMRDPDFIDNVVQVSRVQSIDLFGQSQITECSVNTVGSVQPSNFKEIQRIPEALRVADMMSFWIQGTIVATAPGKYTDILVFKGKRYRVISVVDWSAWGEGWSTGACVAELPS